jgi:hypothetical protein
MRPQHIEHIDARMSALGRKRTLNLAILAWQKRPLWRKADIKSETLEIRTRNVRFTLGSGHSANIGQRVR